MAPFTIAQTTFAWVGGVCLFSLRRGDAKNNLDILHHV